MEKQLTVRDVVENTIMILERINVPVSLINDIGIPLTHALGNLKACCEAWTRDDIEQDHKRRQEEADAQDDGGPKVEIVEIGGGPEGPGEEAEPDIEEL